MSKEHKTYVNLRDCNYVRAHPAFYDKFKDCVVKDEGARKYLKRIGRPAFKNWTELTEELAKQRIDWEQRNK